MNKYTQNDLLPNIIPINLDSVDKKDTLRYAMTWFHGELKRGSELKAVQASCGQLLANHISILSADFNVIQI